MSRFSPRAILPWLGLAAIFLGYVAFIVRLHPVELFGVSQDDSIYFSSAKAISEGKGYVLPSLPGSPPAANKFPVFYPWLLSWVWRWNPSFPANIHDAAAINVLFGLMYLTFAFIFFRQTIKLTDAEAVLLTAFCAFQPAVLFLSAQIVSDIPFAAIALGSLVLADAAIQRNGSPVRLVACGVLAGLAILTRNTGYPIVAGVLVVAALRRAWREGGIFASTVSVFFAIAVWERLAAVKAGVPAGWATFGRGFRQTWLYYTDYPGFRMLSAPNAHVVGTILLNQFLYLLRQLPAYFLSPAFDSSVVLLVTLLSLILAGFVRTTKRDGWKPIQAAFLFYVALVLAWNYVDWDRFLVPFLPLLAALLWAEWKWIAGEVSREARGGPGQKNRVAAVLIGFGLAVLVIIVAYGSATNRERGRLVAYAQGRVDLLAEKQQAYAWIRSNTAPDSKIVAAEDGCLYLYTGRQSMAYIAMLPFGIYEPKQMQSDLDHIADVAEAIGASYWLGTTEDSEKQLKGMKPALAARLGEVEGALPELFRSSSGSIRIYGLSCVQHPQDPTCSSATRVLFPADRTP